MWRQLFLNAEVTLREIHIKALRWHKRGKYMLIPIQHRAYQGKESMWEAAEWQKANGLSEDPVPARLGVQG